MALSQQTSAYFSSGRKTKLVRAEDGRFRRMMVFDDDDKNEDDDSDDGSDDDDDDDEGGGEMEAEDDVSNSSSELNEKEVPSYYPIECSDTKWPP